MLIEFNNNQKIQQIKEIQCMGNIQNYAKAYKCGILSVSFTLHILSCGC